MSMHMMVFKVIESLVGVIHEKNHGKGVLVWPKLLMLLNDIFTKFFRC